eukprot:6211819-Pleurochrysis_carterae.AAC.4
MSVAGALPRPSHVQAACRLELKWRARVPARDEKTVSRIASRPSRWRRSLPTQEKARPPVLQHDAASHQTCARARLLVEREVLRDGGDAGVGRAAHVRGGERRSELRVLARQVLGVAPAARDAVHVEGGAEQHVGAFRGKLRRDGAAVRIREAHVPRGAERKQRRPRRHLHARACDKRGSLVCDHMAMWPIRSCQGEGRWQGRRAGSANAVGELLNIYADTSVKASQCNHCRHDGNTILWILAAHHATCAGSSARAPCLPDHLWRQRAEALPRVVHVDAGHAEARHAEHRSDVVAWHAREALPADASHEARRLLDAHVGNECARRRRSSRTPSTPPRAAVALARRRSAAVAARGVGTLASGAPLYPSPVGHGRKFVKAESPRRRDRRARQRRLESDSRRRGEREPPTATHFLRRRCVRVGVDARSPKGLAVAVRHHGGGREQDTLPL